MSSAPEDSANEEAIKSCSLSPWPLNDSTTVKSRYEQPLGAGDPHERVRHRQELCVKARHETIRIMSFRQIQRDAVKESIIRNKTLDEMETIQAAWDRNSRWNDKLKRSPFAKDLVLQLERAQQLAEEKELAEKQEARERYIRHRDAHNLIFKRAVADSDHLEMLRREKRILLENEKKLAAMCDVEKTNARAIQIHRDRQQKEIERQQRLLQKRISAVMDARK
ncbi:hypothetical protein FOL47_003896 [Perkinsus chesapeaki]|uniref:Uncharacterized protein n=1 Tax=Perkinsus chesapeaki TaxID=330153 RepID=A0A7J6M5H2_PERCH|nr:hypothetical protein FOL47_003896 [Perkinsus chesapeaki]